MEMNAGVGIGMRIYMCIIIYNYIYCMLPWQPRKDERVEP